MTPERYRQIGQLYHRALELESDERAAFLDRACGSDDELRHEVESLLQVPEQARDFIPNAVAEAVAKWEADSLVGSIIGHYKVLDLIGAGGMGEIYLAQDTKLGRKVALKLLPKEFMQDEERVRRFEQEARAASALSHPNIVTIFEIGQADGAHYIATEYIEGQTLRQWMQGGLPELSEVVEVGVQIASALAAAHETGIAHRDIKPENVMLRRDGYVKVLDFGIAKLIKNPRPHDSSAAPTLVSFDTGTGVAIGTAPYMSPEQARGEKDIDTRTDIFSLGALLYEMVAGKSPFAADTVNEALAAVLHVEPSPLTAVRSDAPPEMGRIVEKALRKRREDRYQLASELQDDLLRLKQEVASVPRPAPPFGGARRHGKRMVIALAVALVMLAASGYWAYKLSLPQLPSFQFEGIEQLTSGKVSRAAISPDGSYFVYAEEVQAEQQRLVGQQVNGTKVNEIIEADKVTYEGLTFSPNGEFVYYVRRRKNEEVGNLYRVQTHGGSPKFLLEDIDTPVTFSPDGMSYAFGRNNPALDQSALVVRDIDGASERILKAHKFSDYLCYGGIAWAPDGKTIACSSNAEISGSAERNVVVISVKDGEENLLSSTPFRALSDLAWLSDGKGLLAAAAENHKLQSQIYYLAYPSGEANNITKDLLDYVGISLAAKGKELVTVKTQIRSSIWLVPKDGDTQHAQQITTGPEKYNDVSWASEGRILTSRFVTSELNLWLLDTKGGNSTQLTFDSHLSFRGQMSLDSRYIVYVSNQKGPFNIYRRNSDGSKQMQLTHGSGEYSPRITPDNKWVLYYSDNSGTQSLWKISIDGGTPLRLADKVKMAMYPDVSPDGSSIAYCYIGEEKDSRWQVAVMPMSGDQDKKTFDLPLGIIRWHPNNEALTYLQSSNGVSNIWMQPLNGKKPRQLTDFSSEWIGFFDWSKDGEWIAVVRGPVQRDVFLQRLN